MTMKKRFLLLCSLLLLILLTACRNGSEFDPDQETDSTDAATSDNESESTEITSGEVIDPSYTENELGLEFQLSEDGKSYILSSGQNCNAENVIIPAEFQGLPVTEIGEWAFASCMMKSVTIGSSVTVIGGSAFDSCHRLTSIVIPDSVELIGVGAFCASALESVTIGAGVRTIAVEAFCSTNLKKVVIPSSVEVIGEVAFSGCDQLEEVVIQDGVKRIEQWAFRDCKRLKTVILPNTLEYMEAETFRESPSIEYNIYQGMKYLGSQTNPYFALVGSDGGTRLVPHLDTVFYMSKALYDCEDIVSVEVGSNVQFIGYGALGGMDALEEITVHPDNKYYYVVNNILFEKSTNLPIQGCKTSVIPSDGSITEIDLEIFNSIATIETIHIPKGIKKFELSFQFMSGLKSIIIETDVEHIVNSGNHCGCISRKEACSLTVYHCHIAEQWENVEVEYTFKKIGIHPIDCYGDYATHYFYSETKPTGEGHYWHYLDGVPTPWEEAA